MSKIILSLLLISGWATASFANSVGSAITLQDGEYTILTVVGGAAEALYNSLSIGERSIQGTADFEKAGKNVNCLKMLIVENRENKTIFKCDFTVTNSGEVTTNSTVR